VSRIATVIVGCAVMAAACSGGDDPAAATDPAGPTDLAGASETAADTTVVVAEQPPPDLSANSYVDNLLAKERDGEWDRGEGLLATLRLVTGGVEPADVLRHEEVIHHDLTGIIAMARDFLAASPDAPPAPEIAALLDGLVLSNERLEAMAGIGPETASAANAVAIAALQSAEEDCTKFFPNFPMEGVGQCLEVEEHYVLDAAGEGPYRVFKPAEGLPTGGWTDAHFTRARQAMEDSVLVFSGLAGIPDVEIPPVNLVFSPSAAGYAAADPVADAPCGVVLWTKLQEFTPDEFKQVVAHELGHCLQTENFVAQNEVDYEYRRWREEGLAEYLSNMVYPTTNLEWRDQRLEWMTEHELSTTLLDRAYVNGMFFQHLANIGGNELVFDLVRSMPAENGYQPQRGALEAYPGMFEHFHEFVKVVTDEHVADTGGGFGPYRMTEPNYPRVEITQPGTVVVAALQPFGLVRRHLVLEPGKQACLTWDDEDLLVEHRPHPEGVWAPLPELLPPGLEESGNVALAVTARRPGVFALVVSSVHDLNENQDGELVGTWVVQNGSLAEELDYLAPVQTVTSISGRIAVTFRRDGTVHIAYDGFTVAGFSDVDLEDGSFSSKFYRTFESVTDAEGTDTYEVANDFIFYGELSESQFLAGSETVSETFRGVFLGIETDDIELETRLPESSVHDRPATGWSIIGAGTRFAFACGGEYLLINDVVLRRAS
jgi:hypothetical protein